MEGGATVAVRRYRLAGRRETVGYSQEQLAHRLGCERSTIVRWERAETTPLPTHRRGLARELQVSLDELAEMLADIEHIDEPETEPSDTSTRGATPAVGSGSALSIEGHQGLIEVDQRLDIDVADDGWVTLSFRHEILNRGPQPIRRYVRELWFQHTAGGLEIEPRGEGDHIIGIQRIHDTPNLAKFACLISPPVLPGEKAVMGYTCTGGRFVDDHYWRQATPRYAEHLSLSLRHRGAEALVDYGAVEERPDGSEVIATDDVEWSYDGKDVLISVSRHHLQPFQAVTLRWRVRHPLAGAAS